MRSFINVGFIFFMVVIIITAGACRYDKVEFIPCPTISAKFSADVEPIIHSKCAIPTCHDAGGGLSGVELITYTQIHDNAARIRVRCVVEQTMPAAGPLPPNEIAILRCWIDNGAQNN